MLYDILSALGMTMALTAGLTIVVQLVLILSHAIAKKNTSADLRLVFTVFAVGVFMASFF